MKLVRTALTGAVVALVAGVAAAAPASAAPTTYEITPYDGVIYSVTDGKATALSYDQWVAAGKPTPTTADVTYASYPWSSAIYTITPWSNGGWAELDYDGWVRAGRPAAKDVAWVPGSYVFKWGTGDQVGVIEPAGDYHWFTHAQWAAAGYPDPDVRSNEGFAKLSWAPEIARMTNVSQGAGSPIGFETWKKENFPKPQAVKSFPGETFYRQAGSPDIYYAGPTMNRVISHAEWVAAGSPTPEVRGVESQKLYSLAEFKRAGVIHWDGKKYTYYSQSVLPGGGLNIPGRHVNADGYVSDGDGYIVLAHSSPKGTVIQTPFGYPGKVYDRGTSGNHYDVYIK